MMTQRLLVPPAPDARETYCQQFDGLFRGLERLSGALGYSDPPPLGTGLLRLLVLLVSPQPLP